MSRVVVPPFAALLGTPPLASGLLDLAGEESTLVLVAGAGAVGLLALLGAGLTIVVRRRPAITEQPARERPRRRAAAALDDDPIVAALTAGDSPHRPRRGPRPDIEEGPPRQPPT